MGESATREVRGSTGDQPRADAGISYAPETAELSWRCGVCVEQPSWTEAQMKMSTLLERGVRDEAG